MKKIDKICEWIKQYCTVIRGYTVTMLVLKLTGEIGLSWWWVLTPYVVMTIIGIVIVAVCEAIMASVGEGVHP